MEDRLELGRREGWVHDHRVGCFTFGSPEVGCGVKWSDHAGFNGSGWEYRVVYKGTYTGCDCFDSPEEAMREAERELMNMIQFELDFEKEEKKNEEV